MVRSQSLLLLSICSLLLLPTHFAFIPSNHPALIVPRHHHSSRLFIQGTASYLKSDTALYAKTTVKKSPFQRAKTPPKKNTRAKTPSKQAAKRSPFQRAKTPSKQIAKKKPFQRAKTPSKQKARAKIPSKQTAKKSPFQRAKTPSKQIAKKKPFQRAKTPSKQKTRAKIPSKQTAKKKPFQRAKISSKRKGGVTKTLFPQTAVGPPLLNKIIVVGGTLTVTLGAALVLSLSYINPSSSIGDFSPGKAASTTKVKKNVIGKRKASKAPKEYIDLDDIPAVKAGSKSVVDSPPEKTVPKETKEEPVKKLVEEKQPEAPSPAKPKDKIVPEKTTTTKPTKEVVDGGGKTSFDLSDPKNLQTLAGLSVAFGAYLFIMKDDGVDEDNESMKKVDVSIGNKDKNENGGKDDGKTKNDDEKQEKLTVENTSKDGDDGPSAQDSDDGKENVDISSDS